MWISCNAPSATLRARLFSQLGPPLFSVLHTHRLEGLTIRTISTPLEAAIVCVCVYGYPPSLLFAFRVYSGGDGGIVAVRSSPLVDTNLFFFLCCCCSSLVIYSKKKKKEGNDWSMGRLYRGNQKEKGAGLVG